MMNEVFIHEHLNEFNSLMNELLGTNMKVDGEGYTTLLLCSMSDLPNKLIMSVSYVTKLNLDSVIASCYERS